LFSKLKLLTSHSNNNISNNNNSSNSNNNSYNSNNYDNNSSIAIQHEQQQQLPRQQLQQHLQLPQQQEQEQQQEQQEQEQQELAHQLQQQNISDSTSTIDTPQQQHLTQLNTLTTTDTTAHTIIPHVQHENVDYTKIAVEMEKKFGELDDNNALHPTIIKTGNIWTKKSYKSLLGEQQTLFLKRDEQRMERDQAFDLLDALTKSGAETIENASLHVVIAASHFFEKSLMNTVVHDNINPIEKLEMSLLIVASTIHQTFPDDLLASNHL